MNIYSLMYSKTSGLTWLTLLALLCIATEQNAYGHGAGGDIALFSTNGQVDVGFAILDKDDVTQLVFDADENVFSLVLLSQNPNPVIPWQFGTSEPGFDADGEADNEDRDALPPEAAITYNILDLSYWDGDLSGGVNFSPATGIQGGVAPSPEKSFPNGGFHSHPLFGVTDPDGTAPDGVYVGKLTVSVEGLTDSDPYYMVALVTQEVTNLGAGLSPEDQAEVQAAAAEEIGEMARLYADDPLNNPVPIYEGTDFTFFANAISQVRATAAVPEPGSMGLLTIALLSAGVIGRRRA